MNRQKVTRSLRVFEGISIHELYEQVANLDDPRLYFEDDYGDLYAYVRYMEDENDQEMAIRLATEARANKAKETAKEKRRQRFLELKKEFDDA